MFNLFFSVDAKRNDSELIKRTEKERQQDIHSEDKFSSKILYKIMKEDLSFLDMYPGMSSRIDKCVIYYINIGTYLPYH